MEQNRSAKDSISWWCPTKVWVQLCPHLQHRCLPIYSTWYDEWHCTTGAGARRRWFWAWSQLGLCRCPTSNRSSGSRTSLPMCFPCCSSHLEYCMFLRTITISHLTALLCQVFLVEVLFLLLGHCLFATWIPAWVPDIEDRPYLVLLPVFTGTSIVSIFFLFCLLPATQRWSWPTRIILVLVFSSCTSALVVQYILLKGKKNQVHKSSWKAISDQNAACYLLSQFCLGILYM